MKLSDMLVRVDYKCIAGDSHIEVTDIVYDSRKIKEGCVFVCIDGVISDGHLYASEAVKKGAVALILEHPVDVGESVTQILVKSTRIAMAYMSAQYFNNPAQCVKLIGITGTKGKTSTAFMIKDILDKAGCKCGIIGTIGAFWGDTKVKTGLTTPESYVIHSLFRRMVDDGCDCIVMEVSSQALKLNRTAGIDYDIAVFTNFSPDHISDGEHSSLEEYRKCKELLFCQSRIGIFNNDDELADTFMSSALCEELYTFGTDEDADLCAKDVCKWSDNGVLGVTFNSFGLLNGRVELEIPGVFNVYNAMAAMLVCNCLSISNEIIFNVLASVRILGRVELVHVSEDFSVIIDYAHNEVSTRSVLNTLKEYDPTHIICVYGGGGNRSKLRRYDMGEVTGELADLSVLTCDNPRDEEIESINNDIKIGLARHKGKYVEIPDRTDAISYALQHAVKGDIVVLLGKGHEDYQEIKGIKHHYDERKAVREAAKRL